MNKYFMNQKPLSFSKKNTLNINWYPGHMAKAKREIEEKLKLIDLVVEIVDARVPLASHNAFFDDLKNKRPYLLILNKSDLADQAVNQKWSRYFAKQKIIFMMLQANKQQEYDRAYNMIQEILTPARLKMQKKGIFNPQLKILVAGAPNVGKSTFINLMVKKNKAKTANYPGVTKGQQWLRIDDQCVLLDTPGMLWPKIKSDLVAVQLGLSNLIKYNVLPQPAFLLYALDLIKEYYPTYMTQHLELQEHAVELKTNQNLFEALMDYYHHRFPQLNDEQCYQRFIKKLQNSSYHFSWEHPPKISID